MPACVQKLVEEMGMELREFSWPDRWWLEKEGRMLESHDTDEEIDQMHHLFAKIFTEE